MGGKVSFPRISLDRERTVIVTGGNTGIGYETAKWIAFLGAKVIIACRSEIRAKEAIDKMKAEFQAEKDRGTAGIIQDGELNVQYMQLDLGSLKSTKSFIDAFKSSGNKLHSIICNAGIGMHAQEYTEDENELMFQVNYLGHLLICLYLIPLMKQSGFDDCRIVMVSSAAHLVAAFNMSTIQGNHLSKANFDRLKYYGNSKLYMIMQMYFMNRRLKDSNIHVLSIHPGIVETEINRSFQDLGRWKFFFRLSKMIGVTKNPLEGAETTINAAINPDLKGVRDVYYVNCKPTSTSSTARNMSHQESLLKYSLDRLKDYLSEDILKDWVAVEV